MSDDTGTLPGVNVIIKGTNTDVETDFDRVYTITAKVGDVLMFSYIDVDKKSVTVGNANTINVTLTGGNLLDELVVTAFGIKKKQKEMSYSLTSVKGDDLTKTKLADVATALVGKVFELQMTENTYKLTV